MFHMPSFDATVFRGLPAFAASSAIFRCYGSCALCAERDRAVWGGGLSGLESSPPRPILLHNSGFSQRNSLDTEAGVTSFFSFKRNLESIYCLSSLESVAVSSFFTRLVTSSF